MTHAVSTIFERIAAGPGRGDGHQMMEVALNSIAFCAANEQSVVAT